MAFDAAFFGFYSNLRFGIPAAAICRIAHGIPDFLPNVRAQWTAWARGEAVRVAVARNVSASTQNQGLSALLVLYQTMLELPLGNSTTWSAPGGRCGFRWS